MCLFTEYRTMWPVPESAQQHIHSHLRKSLVHYLEDEAYDGLHKKIYDLERCIRDRNAYDSVTADIISDILTIISS